MQESQVKADAEPSADFIRGLQPLSRIQLDVPEISKMHSHRKDHGKKYEHESTHI